MAKNSFVAEVHFNGSSRNNHLKGYSLSADVCDWQAETVFIINFKIKLIKSSCNDFYNI